MRRRAQKTSDSVSIARRGSALVAVFWVLTILAIVLTATSRIVKYDSDVIVHQVHGFRAKQLAESGANLAVHPEVENGDIVVVGVSQRGGVDPDEGYEFSIQPEDIRFNINRLISNMETGTDLFLREILVEEWGVNSQLADSAIGALRDWIDQNDEINLNGAESEYYSALGRVNQPYNRVFYSLDEMTLVRDWNEVVAEVPNWRNWFTVLSPNGLNINYAEPFLIAAATDAEETTVDEVIRQQVVGEDGALNTEDDVIFEDVEQALQELGVNTARIDFPEIVARFSAGESSVQRIESTGWSSGFGHRLTLVVQDQNGQPIVLERTEEVIPWQAKEN